MECKKPPYGNLEDLILLEHFIHVLNTLMLYPIIKKNYVHQVSFAKIGWSGWQEKTSSLSSDFWAHGLYAKNTCWNLLQTLIWGVYEYKKQWLKHFLGFPLLSPCLEVQVLNGKHKDDSEENRPHHKHTCDCWKEAVFVSKEAVDIVFHTWVIIFWSNDFHWMIYVTELRDYETIQCPGHRTYPVIPNPPYWNELHHHKKQYSKLAVTWSGGAREVKFFSHLKHNHCSKVYQSSTNNQ